MAKKKVTKKVTTKKPTGLTITRDGEWYTVKWKIGDANYSDGQQLQYRLNYQKKWHSLKVGKKTTAKKIKLERADYFPNTTKKLTSVKFRVRGNRQEYKKSNSKKETTYKCSWSHWATKEFVIKVPSKPKATATLHNELTNVCTFGWTAESTEHRPFTNVKWESRLAPKESNVTDGSKLKWDSSQMGWRSGINTNTTGSFQITEDTATLANGSYTRWVRFIARGVAGASTGKPDGWTYVKHTYSTPYKPVIKSVSARENTVGGFSCRVVWTADAPKAHPIDKTTVQYTIVEPEEGLTCPSGASWTDANISRDTKEKDAALFSIDDTLSRDQCLFVRVNVQHDSNVTYGAPKLAKVGYLKDPTGLSVQTDDVTHRATITATNASNIEDSYLAIVYRTASKPSGAFVVGVIPHGSTSAIVQCPDWSNESAVSFSVYAVVGSYTRQSRSGGVYVYKINSRMRSKNTITDGGTVPTAPDNVQVAQTSIQGTVQVTWDWTWDDANGAEISWADHEDAWESTDEPETYMISKLHAARWNISGLEAGKRWYIRVRLVNETGEGTTNSPWSDLTDDSTIDLSSAPTTPQLFLSSSVIPQDGSVTASWAYSTTDGTMQAYAEICEAAITGEGITYGDIIAHTETAQQTVIIAKDAGWHSGETHNLCVRVTSASGHVSDTWSDPIAITIAEPLSVEITQSSLVWDTVEESVTEYSGDLIQIEDGDGAPLIGCKVNITPKQSGTGTPSPTNVRPISGWESVNVTITDRNLADYTTFTSGYIASNGDVNSAEATTQEKVSDYIEIEAGSEYNFSATVRNSEAKWIGIGIYDSNKSFIKRVGGLKGNGEVTSQALTASDTTGAKYVRVSFRSYGIAEQVSLTKDTTTTTTTVNLGRTVYGGTLDVVSGVLTVDRAMVTFNGSETWALNATGGVTRFSTISKLSDAMFVTGGRSPIVSDSLEYAPTANPVGHGFIYGLADKAQFFVIVDQSITTVTQFTAWLADNPITIVYELLQPQTYTLTGQEIETLLGENTIWADTGSLEVKTGISRTGWFLEEMPLTVTATGAGVGGLTTLAIERAESYHLDRPDERSVDGYEGETVFLHSQTGEAQITADVDSLIGALDDGARYRIVATAQDGLGQFAEDSVDFAVHWSHQAIMPEATVEIDEQNLVAKITPVAPQGAEEGDVCDIYRLSADRPELIVRDAVFGQTYVDPYPAIGEFGGHRIVFKTVNGDYITEDNQMAWIDFGEDEEDMLDLDYHVIDFDGNQVLLNYNVDLSSQWDKDFTETKYLGGSVQGDWNPAVSRTGSISATAITITDQEMIRNMRRLASYSGRCHVRTKDGSSYEADIQVSEDRDHEDYDKIATFSMTVTRVDPEAPEGLPLELWQGEQ